MEIWHYLENQFLNSTIGNFKKAMKLSNYHHAMMKKVKDEHPGDPEWAIPFDRYDPLHLALVNAYNEWKVQGGQQEGETLNVTQLLTLLRGKAGKWSGKVQAEFDKTTPQYKALFPNGLYPLTQGSILTRIEAVQHLGTALTGIAPLAALKTEVDAFYTTLDIARDTQEVAKGGTGALSDAVEIARKPNMIMQYRNLGFFIDRYGFEPTAIANFFELNVLRDNRQVLFTGTLDPGENEAVLIHTFVADDEIRLKITGAAGQATFYLASSPNGTNSTAVNVAVGENKTDFVAQFAPANYGTHRYLTAVNSGLVELHYEVELL